MYLCLWPVYIYMWLVVHTHAREKNSTCEYIYIYVGTFFKPNPLHGGDVFATHISIHVYLVCTNAIGVIPCVSDEGVRGLSRDTVGIVIPPGRLA